MNWNRILNREWNLGHPPIFIWEKRTNCQWKKKSCVKNTPAQVSQTLKAVIPLWLGTLHWVQFLWKHKKRGREIPTKFASPPLDMRKGNNGCRVNVVIYQRETEWRWKSAVKPPAGASQPQRSSDRRRLWNNNDFIVDPIQGGGFTCSLANRCFCNGSHLLLEQAWAGCGPGPVERFNPTRQTWNIISNQVVK